ncbi:hypothetical protein N7541_002198 [Penicillium brevicompactum]|uniref:Uncharacterized protein n=1 Tax=Penicillium brevicompactum TaxID=5074 RepID=A0A9W9RM00_PENBR|nr:hypothetical protein N7541_002198 [Penicillium brevicompactum]
MSDEIRRGNFSYDNGVLRAEPGHMARIEGPKLRDMFLPKLSTDATKALNQDPDFVRSQLTHYGVEFEEKEFNGKGTTLLKKAIQEGKCDEVPQSILDLQDEMYHEWLEACDPRQLRFCPEWIMDKYFLHAGQPQPTKTTTVIDILFPRNKSAGPEPLMEAAAKIPGLHSIMRFFSMTQVLFLGWDSAAVEKTANEHADRKRKELQKREDDRKAAEEIQRGLRRQLHLDYIERRSKGQANASQQSPVGTYTVDCKGIQEQWSDMDNLSMDIRNSDLPGVFIADIDFGIVKGIMIICAQQSLLNEYCFSLDGHEEENSEFGDELEFGDSFGFESDLGSESESESVQLDKDAELIEHGEEALDEEDDEDDEEEIDEEEQSYRAVAHAAAAAASKDLLSASKRKAPASESTSSKKQKTTDVQPGKYFLQLRCYETGEGEVQEPGDGTITFQNGTFDSFVGDAELPFVSGEGSGIFSAYKISDVPR